MLVLAVSGAAAEGHGGGVDLGGIILHHVSNSGPWGLGWSKLVFMMAIAALLVVIGVLRAVRGYDENGVPRTRWSQMLDPFIEHFYRDVAMPHVGKKWAARVAPLLLTFFFFILTCNLLGLVPWADALHLANHLAGNHMSHGEGATPWVAEAGAGAIANGLARISMLTEGASTATGNFNVTASLALITFFAIIVFGVRQHGVIGHFAHLAPKGVPFPVRWFLLLPIETLSMFVKPFALTMRLAANMTAGHMGILALLLGFIYAAQAADLSGSIGGLPAALLATAIMMLEIIVCFVQAYVFALLSGVFIGMAVHHH
ncbi:MAG: F0F1 ATP synthase subunit A [Acidobacteria bacterium]|nr:F0F1 ATP synthase subunit A [Acidobacteriota bacterium]